MATSHLSLTSINEHCKQILTARGRGQSCGVGYLYLYGMVDAFEVDTDHKLLVDYCSQIREQLHHLA